MARVKARCRPVPMSWMRRVELGIVPGMAHLAGGGPEGLTCGDCDHFEPSTHDGGLCRKALELAPGKRQPLIWPGNKACKHFDLKPNQHNSNRG